jgi:DNA-binding LacI/PurR family transcriptional regulator
MDERVPTAVALEHLHGLSHRRIGQFRRSVGVLDRPPARAQAFRAATGRLRLAEAPVLAGELSERGGAEAAAMLLGRFLRLTALTVGTLAQTIGVLHTAWLAVRTVPRDLSLVVHDDLPLAAYLRPPLTRIQPADAELGAAGVDALVDQLGGRPPRDVLVHTSATIVPGDSTSTPLDATKPIS